MYILNKRNNLCFKEIKTFGKQNKLRHAKDKVKSSDLDFFFLSQTNLFLFGRNHSHRNPQKEGSCQNKSQTHWNIAGLCPSIKGHIYMCSVIYIHIHADQQQCSETTANGQELH